MNKNSKTKSNVCVMKSEDAIFKDIDNIFKAADLSFSDINYFDFVIF